MVLILSDLRTRTKVRYERNGASNDARNSTVDMFVNDAIREIINTVGDNAYFLRKTTTVVALQYPNVTTLTSSIKRLYRLEDETNAPGQPIPWSFIRHTDLGEMVIVVQCAGTFLAHYLMIAPGLVNDSDPTLIPDEHAELILAMACKRLADAVGNASMSAIMERDAMFLMKAFKRDCLRYSGQRHEALQTNWSARAVGPWSNAPWP